MSKIHSSSTEDYGGSTGQPVDSGYQVLSPAAQEQLAYGSIAIGTILCMSVLLREVRLLVQACKF
jgi:hypothetical protein